MSTFILPGKRLATLAVGILLAVTALSAPPAGASAPAPAYYPSGPQTEVPCPR